MKYIFMLNIYTICALIVFSSSISAADIMDCPAEKQELCAEIKQLEEVYLQLPNQAGFQEKDLSGPASALALGYANIVTLPPKIGPFSKLGIGL